MKKTFLLFMMLSIASFGQNATWYGTKTINPNFKLANIFQNDSNTKLLSLDNVGKLSWVDKGTLGGGSTTPNITQVLQSGNSDYSGKVLSFINVSGPEQQYANLSKDGLVISRGISFPVQEQERLTLTNTGYTIDRPGYGGNGIISATHNYGSVESTLLPPDDTLNTFRIGYGSMQRVRAGISFIVYFGKPTTRNSTWDFPENIPSTSFNQKENVASREWVNSIFLNAPVYADNAAALSGGLIAGNIYRTSTGDLKIVY